MRDINRSRACSPRAADRDRGPPRRAARRRSANGARAAPEPAFRRARPSRDDRLAALGTGTADPPASRARAGGRPRPGAVSLAHSLRSLRRRARSRRWLVSQNGYRRLRRHTHSAHTGRSELTRRPPGSTNSTGPSTSTGPPTVGVSRRRAASATEAPLHRVRARRRDDIARRGATGRVSGSPGHGYPNPGRGNRDQDGSSIR